MKSTVSFDESVQNFRDKIAACLESIELFGEDNIDRPGFHRFDSFFTVSEIENDMAIEVSALLLTKDVNTALTFSGIQITGRYVLTSEKLQGFGVHVYIYLEKSKKIKKKK